MKRKERAEPGVKNSSLFHFIEGSSIKSAYFGPLLDVGLPQGAPELPILRLPHPVEASNLLQVVGPSCWRAPYATLSDPRSPLKDSSAPTM